MSTPAFHPAQLTVADVDRSRAFHPDVLGLEELARPQFSFPGAWFQPANGQGFKVRYNPAPVAQGVQKHILSGILGSLGLTKADSTLGTR